MKKKPNILCTICARGGSKGVKDKNIRLLAGKPLLAHTIEDARKWGKARRIVVSTDSKRIAGVAKKHGAEVPFMRPKALAGDSAPKVAAIRHALLESEKAFGERYDIVVDLDATAPLRKVKDLDNCLEIFLEKEPMSLFSVVKAHRNPYFNMVEDNGSGFVRLSKKLGKKSVTSRQKAPAVYSMNASIYFYRRDFLLDKKHITPFSNRTLAYVMDDLSAHDIDSAADLQFIDFLIRKGIWRDEK